MNILALVGIKEKINTLRQRVFTRQSLHVSVSFQNMRITQLSTNGDCTLNEIIDTINQSLAEQEQLALATLL